MAAAAAKLWSSYPSHRLSTPAKKKLSNSPKSIFPASFCPSKPTLSLSPPPIHASNSPVEDETSSSDGIIPQEDLKYLWKLGAGSVAASALIKYGSVLFPQITTPNLFVALVVVSTPVIVAVFILVKKSRSELPLLKYLWKLGTGSVAAAALIKYGSVLFPQITTPNLFVALVIVSTPVLVAVFILIKKSRSG